MLQQITASQAGMQPPDPRILQRNWATRPGQAHSPLRHDVLGLHVPQKRRTGRPRARRHINLILADGFMQEDELLALSALCELKARDDAAQGPRSAPGAERRSAHGPRAGPARPSSSSSDSRRRPLASTQARAAAAAASVTHRAALSGAQVAMAQAAAPQRSMAIAPLHLPEHMSGPSDLAAREATAASAAAKRREGVWSKEVSPTGSPSQHQRSCSAASDLTAAGSLLNLLAPCGSPTAAAGAFARPVGQSRLAGTPSLAGRDTPSQPQSGAGMAAAAPAAAKPSTHPGESAGGLLPTAAYSQPSHMADLGARAVGGPSSGPGRPSSGVKLPPNSRAAPSSAAPEGGLRQGPGLAPPVVPPVAAFGGSSTPLAPSGPPLTADLFLEPAAGFVAPMDMLLGGSGVPGLFSQQLGMPVPALGHQQQGNALLLAAVLTAQQGPAAGLLAGGGAAFAAPAVAAAAAAARAVEEHLSVAFGSSSGSAPFVHHLGQGVLTPGLPPGQVDALAALPALAAIPTAAAAAAAAGGVLGLPVAAGMEVQLAQAFRGVQNSLPLPGWLNLSC